MPCPAERDNIKLGSTSQQHPLHTCPPACPVPQNVRRQCSECWDAMQRFIEQPAASELLMVQVGRCSGFLFVGLETIMFMGTAAARSSLWNHTQGCPSWDLYLSSEECQLSNC